MYFIEFRPFSKRISKFKAKTALESLKDALAIDPKKGVVVRGTGGCRKIRIPFKEGKGKSSGGRIIYYFLNKKERIYFLLIYAKNEQTSLNSGDKFKNIVERLKYEK